jgi:hypothetical protein
MARLRFVQLELWPGTLSLLSHGDNAKGSEAIRMMRTRGTPMCKAEARFLINEREGQSWVEDAEAVEWERN